MSGLLNNYQKFSSMITEKLLNDLAKRQMGATMEKQAVGGLKNLSTNTISTQPSAPLSPLRV